MPVASKPRLIPCDLDLAAWVAHPPSADAVRPKHCPACGAPSRPLGCPLGIRGHGSRARQVRGPLQPDGPWVTVTIRARRFLCRCGCRQRCGATMLVVPAGVLAHRRYSAPALATALALYGLERLAPGRVRAHATGPADAADWPSLRRWCQQVRAGALFPDDRPMPPCWRGRRVAERVATTLAAYALPSPRPFPLRQQAFRGASRSLITATPVPGGAWPPTNTERFTGNWAKSRQVPASAAGSTAARDQASSGRGAGADGGGGAFSSLRWSPPDARRRCDARRPCATRLKRALIRRAYAPFCRASVAGLCWYSAEITDQGHF